MAEERHEGPADTSSERKKKERKKEVKREKAAEKTAAAMVKAAEKTELLAEKQEKLITTVDKLIDRGEDLAIVFENLSSAIKEGVIKDFKQLSRVMKRFGKGIKDAEKRISKSALIVQGSFERAAEYSDKVADAQKDNARAIGKHLEALDQAYKGMQEAAEAAEAAGITMGPPGARPPRYEKGKKDEGRGWFESELRRLEEEDRSFADNWRRTWPLEQYLASVPPEEIEFYRELAQKFEDRRRLHDYQWFYKRAAGTEAILNAAAILPTGAIERTLRQEGIVESMVKLQGLAENVVEARREGEEEREAELKSKILRFMGGEIDLDEEGNEIEADEDQAAINRLGGRLFTVLGFTASYDFSEFAGGDFFVARLMHLKQRFKDQADEEGKRWFGRDKLWEHFDPEIFGNNFAGGVLANLPGHKDRRDPFFDRFGLELMEEDREDDAGRKLRVLKIRNPERFRQLDLRQIGILEEGYLGAVYADAFFKADDARKLFLKPDQYLDRPNMEHFLGLRGDFEHLKGDKRWRFFATLLGDLIDFHRGPSVAEQARRLFFEAIPVKDPHTGKEAKGGWLKSRGLQWFGSDARRLGEEDWGTGEIHKKVDTALGHQMISPSYAEWILREKIKFLGIPGYGPVRVTKEIIDMLGLGGFIALIFAPILEFIRQLAKEMGVEVK